MLRKHPEDLLQNQIQESCRLALPEGLKELMSDISREVLRAQPQNLYGFIADYLAAMLVTRENLFIASRLCGEPCDAECQPELEEELRDIGLDKEDVEKAKEIIDNHLGLDNVKESNLLTKLSKKTNILQSQFPAVVHAVRRAFLRHRATTHVIYETSSESDEDEVTTAARHTLHLYRQTGPSVQDYDQKAIKIQKAYRAFGVRRAKSKKDSSETPNLAQKEVAHKSIHFDTQVEKQTREIYMISKYRRGQSIGSSSSLAGSYLLLPDHKPYTAFDDSTESSVCPEKERGSIDYTKFDESHDKIEMAKPKSQKIISFSESTQEIIEDDSIEANIESEESIGEDCTTVAESIDLEEEITENNENQNWYNNAANETL